MTDDELRSTVDTPEIEQAVLADARAGAPLGERLSANYEHGQWWITDFDTGAQWSVVDCWSGAVGDYFGFEQVTEGDEL